MDWHPNETPTMILEKIAAQHRLIEYRYQEGDLQDLQRLVDQIRKHDQEYRKLVMWTGG